MHINKDTAVTLTYKVTDLQGKPLDAGSLAYLHGGYDNIFPKVEQALEGENTALPTFVEARNQFELNYLRKLLQITKGNVTHAARMAGRNRTEFYKLLSRHELDANDFKE